MSWEKVYKFCELCCEYNRRFQEDKSTSYLKLRDNATKVAIEGLEDHREVGTSQLASETCRTCDYEEPRIAQIVADLKGWDLKRWESF